MVSVDGGESSVSGWIISVELIIILLGVGFSIDGI
jgi:hypothetical protein